MPRTRLLGAMRFISAISSAWLSTASVAPETMSSDGVVEAAIHELGRVGADQLRVERRRHDAGAGFMPNAFAIGDPARAIRNGVCVM